MNATEIARRADALRSGELTRRELCYRLAEVEDVSADLMRKLQFFDCHDHVDETDDDGIPFCDGWPECGESGRCPIIERMRLLRLWRR